MSAAQRRRAGADGLCRELVDAILQHVAWPTDLRALALVSRWWNLCATPRLYSCLPIMSSRPAQTLALLLLLESDPARAACVRAVLFDEALFPRWRDRRPRTETHYHTRGVPVFAVHQQDLLRDVALALDRVLPRLPNLRAVRMKRAHPLLMSVHASLARPSAKHLFVTPWRHRTRSYLNIYTVGEQGTTWAALARLPCTTTTTTTTSSSSSSVNSANPPSVRPIEHLSTRLWSRCAPPAHALSHLRTLALTGAAFRDWSAAREWAPALAHLPSLDALLLADFDAELGELVTGGMHAPKLRALVLHRVRVAEWEYVSLGELVRRHAGTIEMLGLDVRWEDDGPGPLAVLFSDAEDDALRIPNLRILRVHNLASLSCTRCALSIERTHAPPRDSGNALLHFVRAHLDAGSSRLQELGVTGLPAETRSAFEALAFELDRLVLLGAGTARSTGPPPAGSLLEKERWLRDVFLLRGTPFEGEPWDAPPPRGRLRKTHPMQPTW